MSLLRQFLVVLLLIVIACPTLAHAADEKLPIKCTVGENGELEMWEENGEKVTLGIGGVVLIRGEQRLEADRIVMWSGKVNHCYAEGNVVLKEPSGEKRGEALVYDLDAKKGQFVSARIMAPDKPTTIGKEVTWYVGAPSVEQISPKVIKGMNAWISTCGFDRPHYRFQAKEITLYMDEKITAKHCILFLGNIPVFYIPYMFRDLKHDWSRIEFKAGKHSDWGWYGFARIGWNLNPVVRLITGTDYREQWGWGWPLILDYKRPGKYFGKIDGYYINEWTRRPEPDRIYAGDVRYRTKWYHRQWLRDPWRLDLEYEDFGDDRFRPDYFEGDAWTGKDPECYAYLRGAWEDSAVTGLVRARKTRFLTQTEYLPQIGYRIMSRPFLGNRAYLSSEIEAANLRRENDDNLNLPSPRSWRMDTLTEVHYPFNLFRFLEFDTFCGTRQSWYENSQNDNKPFHRGAAVWGAGLSSTIWRTYNAKSNLLQIDGLRHVIIPGITFTNISDPAASGEPFIFDEADNLDEVEFVNLSLVNRLQSSSGASRDFLYLKVETDYFPRDSHAEREGFTTNWSDVDSTLRVLPHPKLSVSQEMTYDPGEEDISKGSFSVVFNPAALSAIFAKDNEGEVTVSRSVFEARGRKSSVEDWSIGYSNSFVRDTYSTNTITIGGKLTDKWSLLTSFKFEGTGEEKLERSLTLRKQLHKWIMEITFERDDVEGEELFLLSFYPEGISRSFLTFRHKMDEWDEEE